MRYYISLLFVTVFTISAFSQEEKDKPLYNKAILRPLPNLMLVFPKTLRNGDFEEGYSAPGWKRLGPSFTTGPRSGNGNFTWEDFEVVPQATIGGDYWKDLRFHIGYRHNYWVSSKGPGTSGSTNERGRATGTMTSEPFKLYKPNNNYISFLISGAKKENDLKIELLEMRVQHTLRGNTDILTNTNTQIPGVSRPSGNISTGVDTLYAAIPGIPAKTGHNSDIFRRDWWDVQRLDTSKMYVIRITDNATTLNWGTINIDDIRMVKYIPSANREENDSLRVQRITIKDLVTKADQQVYVDYYVPIYGAADMHTHLMSHLAMGRKLLYGAPDSGSIIPAGTYNCNPTDFRAKTIEQCLGNCNSAHGGWGLDNPCGNYIRAAVLNHAFDAEYERRVPFEVNAHGDHPHAGYPAFVDWPHHSSASHQQMYVDWIKRAYEGGLRVLVTLTVNSELLGAVLSGDPPYEDKQTADLQLEEIKLFVKRHSDFMELALDAEDMRRIIRSNRMAVIMGMEVDNLGNFNYPTVPANEAAVKTEIKRLYEKGVRYIFPIHVVNNKFGGAAIYNVLFNISNKYTNSRPIPWGAPIPPGLMFDVQRATDPQIKYSLKLMDAPAGTMNAILVGLRPVFDGLSAIPFPPVFDLIKCPVPVLGCVDQFKIVSSLLVPDPSWDIYNTMSGGMQNKQGLSTLGKFAIKEMMKLGMIIDVDHMSDKSVTDAFQLMDDFDYPMVSGHNGMREGNPGASENQRSNAQLARMRARGGVFGVGVSGQTSNEYLSNFRGAMRKMSNGAVTMGSDINGFVVLQRPRFPSSGSSAGSRVTYRMGTYNPNELVQYSFGNKKWDYNTEGMAHIGLYPDFFQDLKNVGMSLSERQVFFNAADYIVNMWEKCEASKGNVR